MDNVGATIQCLDDLAACMRIWKHIFVFCLYFLGDEKWKTGGGKTKMTIKI